MFNPKDFNLKEIIQRRAEIEAQMEWGKTESVPTPKFKQIKVIKDKAGWLNFALTTLKELRP